MSAKSTSIDWDDVKQRLHASQLALEKALSPGPERTEAIYRERAEQLAKREGDAGSPSTASRMLVFNLGRERYAIDFNAIVELLPFANCTAVPSGPPELLGVINVHGEIRSVVDLGRLLALAEEEGRSPGYVLLVRHRDLEVGLRVSAIDKIQTFASGQLAAACESDTGSSLRYTQGLAVGGLRLLNAEALFAHPIFTKADQL